MSLIGKSLDAVTAAGAGVPINLDAPKNAAGVQITTTGGPSFSLDLEATLDGTNWVALDTFTSVGLHAVREGFSPTAPKLFIGLRANLSFISGGSLTATVAAT